MKNTSAHKDVKLPTSCLASSSGKLNSYFSSEWRKWSWRLDYYN